MNKFATDLDESILEIDKDVLDEEWMSQPSLFFRYAAKEAKADNEVDEAKAELEVTEAELDKAIREDPQDYGILDKCTETAIKNAIKQHKDYQNALEAHHTAKYKAGLLGAMVKALDQRKKALEKLVDLHGQSYFAQPQASDEGKEVIRTQTSKKLKNKV